MGISLLLGLMGIVTLAFGAMSNGGLPKEIQKLVPKGMGGGSMFGLNEEYLYNYLDKVDRSKWPTFDVMTTAAHEVGHMLGYSHDSNMTYSINVTPFQGISEVGSRVLNILLESNDYPISRDNYYMPDDFIGDSTSKKANKLGMGACPSN